jgi:hypothetical protein
MKNDALTKFLELAEHHYWDTLESRQDIMTHIYGIASRSRMSPTNTAQDNKTAEPTLEKCDQCGSTLTCTACENEMAFKI